MAKACRYALRQAKSEGTGPLICPNCSTENQAGAKFCRECGHTLAAGCPNCGFVNLPSSKFCSECGTTLGAAAAKPPKLVVALPPNPVSERRLVSVLFADLVGFTPFAEERDSEDVRDTLSRYFDTARDVIQRYGGTIEKFIGDAVMAVWGAPIAQEDDAERAVRAALDLVEAVGGLRDGVQARAGVLTGEAAVTIGVVGEGMVVGDIVNTASRLQSVAPPGTVIVGEQTKLATSAAIAYQRVDDQQLKGKSSPVPAWRAMRVVAEVGGRNRSEGLEAPFVGRQEEMRLLKELFHATSREKRVRVMSVIGPAGIGKSRLAWEFNKYMDGLVELVWWHTGRSPAYGEGISFWALGEMIRERAKLREGDDEATTRERIAATVEEYVLDANEREWIEKALLTLLGVESGMAADQLFGAWRTFFERMAEQNTVVLVFEDMHFADTGLLDFVDHLLEWSRGLPIYVVTLARPDLIEKRPNWGAGKRNFNSLYLEPLSEADMRELLNGLVPGLPDSAVRTIVARADGIPLYAVETVRTLLGEGKLVIEDGVCVPKGDVSTLTVPATLTALISARLDALDDTDRRILHDASVLGQSFTVAGVAALSDMPGAELEPRLAALVRREILQRQLDPRSPEQGQYAFVQALIREVAYNTLSKHDRKKLHLAAARYFESMGSDELAGVLASHYLAAHAGAAEGGEADALAAQARIALKAAAVRARSLGGYDQARTFAEQAISVTPDLTERVELLTDAAEDARIAGRQEEQEQALRQGLELAAQTGDRNALAVLTARLAQTTFSTFKPDEGAAILAPALAEYADVSERALAELKLANIRLQFLTTEYRKGLQEIEPLLEVAERRSMNDLLAEGLVQRGIALLALGRRREAKGVMIAARDLAAEEGLTSIQLRAIGNLSNILADLDIGESLAAGHEQLALARKAGHRGILIFGSGNVGYGSFLAGEWDAGLAVMASHLDGDMAPRERLLLLGNALIIHTARGESIDDGLAEMERLGKEMSGHWHIFVADPMAQRALAQGDAKAARDFYVEMADYDEGTAHEYIYRAARPAAWLGDVEAVRAYLERVESMGGYGPILSGRIQSIRADIAALEGRTTDALVLYRDALRNFHSAKAMYDAALVGLDMAKLLDPAEPEVGAAIASSREFFEQVGAKPYLEQLNAAASRGGQQSSGPARVRKAEVAAANS